MPPTTVVEEFEVVVVVDETVVTVVVVDPGTGAPAQPTRPKMADAAKMRRRRGIGATIARACVCARGGGWVASVSWTCQPQRRSDASCRER
jgi:hypothetical protein